MKCPICIESLPPNYSIFFCKSLIISFIHELPCCSQIICNQCLYSHIHSIFTEGITGGMRSLTCPLGCGKEIMDTTIRETIRKKNWNYLYGIFGVILFYIFDCVMVHYDRYFYWMNWTKSITERNELRLYEIWSITRALSSTSRNNSSNNNIAIISNNYSDDVRDATSQYIHVIHCPRPDCDCQWLSNTCFRRHKMENEEPYNNTKLPRINSVCASLLYNPISPQVEEELMLNNGFTTEHWIYAGDIRSLKILNNKNNGLKSSSYDRQCKRDGGINDSRRLLCPKCYFSFCGLCSRPWSTICQKTSKRIFHAHTPCGVYGRSTTTDCYDFALVADDIDARSCPKCSMRICRSIGCNHMTCICGMEWCYVCEREWKSFHYGCKDGHKRDVHSHSECNVS